MGGAGYYGYNYYLKSTQDLAAANAKIAALTEQTSALQSELSAAKSAPAASPAPVAEASAATTPVAPASPATEIPATITTLSGKTYTGCVLSRILPDGISFLHSMGVAKVLFSDLDPSFAAKFGYDPTAAKKYEDDEAAHDAQSDALRMAADTTNKSTTAAGGDAGSGAIPAASAPDPAATQANAAAKTAQADALKGQIRALQNQAESLESQEVSDFNSPSNVYPNSQGEVEHLHGMGHSQQAADDRAQIPVLQAQLAQLQN